MPKDPDIVWLAGLLEGEATFVDRPHGGSGRGRTAGMHLRMTDEDVVRKAADAVAKVTATQYSVNKGRPRNSAWKPLFELRVSGSNAVKLMIEIYPLMGYRRKEKIDELLERYCA